MSAITQPMTTLELQNIIPRLSWWKDVKGRNWIITGFTENTTTWLPSQVEMIEVFGKTPVYIDVLPVLESIEKKQMVRL